jgi:ribonuclease HI
VEQYIALWTDGGARGNPGPAAIGGVIAAVAADFDPQTPTEKDVLATYSKYIGSTTNNQAEYQALEMGLEQIAQINQNPNDIILKLFTDSELMAYQIQGKYKVKNAELKPLYERITQILSQYKSYTITPIRREKNQQADKLVNEALDAALARN